MSIANQGQKEQLKKQKAEKLRIAKRTSDWRNAMQNQYTKRVIWDILDMCGIYAEKFMGDDRTFVLLGRESIGREILTRLHDVDPTLYARLILEINDES